MSGHAQRQRDYRQRQNAGEAIYPVKANEIALVHRLKQEGFLTMVDPSHSDICEALQRVVALWIEGDT